MSGHQPSPTWPEILQGFLFYLVDSCFHMILGFQGRAGCLPGLTENLAGLLSLSDWVDDHYDGNYDLWVGLQKIHLLSTQVQ